MTSFQLVVKVRWLLTRRMEGRRIKVGHAGTLDPLATGVMIICTGRATKLIEQLQGGTKTYETTLKLGATTPSFDLEHPIDHTFPTDHITEEEIRRVLAEQFTGDIMQVPPVFSACKVDGKRAYDLARKGKQPELQAKPLRKAMPMSRARARIYVPLEQQMRRSISELSRSQRVSSMLSMRSGLACSSGCLPLRARS